MMAQDVRLGALVRARKGCQWASAGAVGKIVWQYYLGLNVHAVSVRWDAGEPDVEPTIIPRDHLEKLELVQTKPSEPKSSANDEKDRSESYATVSHS
jgi:hypothetical protein